MSASSSGTSPLGELHSDILTRGSRLLLQAGTCNSGLYFTISSGVQYLLYNLLARYRTILPKWQWLQVCCQTAAFLHRLLPVACGSSCHVAVALGAIRPLQQSCGEGRSESACGGFGEGCGEVCCPACSAVQHMAGALLQAVQDLQDEDGSAVRAEEGQDHRKRLEALVLYCGLSRSLCLSDGPHIAGRLRLYLLGRSAAGQVATRMQESEALLAHPLPTVPPTHASAPGEVGRTWLQRRHSLTHTYQQALLTLSSVHPASISHDALLALKLVLRSVNHASSAHGHMHGPDTRVAAGLSGATGERSGARCKYHAASIRSGVAGARRAAVEHASKSRLDLAWGFTELTGIDSSLWPEWPANAYGDMALQEQGEARAVVAWVPLGSSGAITNEVTAALQGVMDVHVEDISDVAAVVGTVGQGEGVERWAAAVAAAIADGQGFPDCVESALAFER